MKSLSLRWQKGVNWSQVSFSHCCRVGILSHNTHNTHTPYTPPHPKTHVMGANAETNRTLLSFGRFHRFHQKPNKDSENQEQAYFDDSPFRLNVVSRHKLCGATIGTVKYFIFMRN